MTWLSDDLSTLASDSEFRVAMRKFLEHYGAQKVMGYGPMNEDMLNAGEPRSALLDTIRYKLQQCGPTTSMTIVDPFLFPSRPDADHESDLLGLIEPHARACSTMTIVTASSHNGTLKASVEAGIRAFNPGLSLTFKFSDKLHDRWWIADEERGILIGTSFGGIGKKYASTDYLAEEDAKAISTMVQQLP